MNQLGIKEGFWENCQFFPDAIKGTITSFEVLGIMEVDLGEGDVGIEWVENPDHVNYWSVYARHKDHRAMCVADVKTKEQAESLKTVLEKLLNLQLVY